MTSNKPPSALEERAQSGARLFSPSSARNKGPIGDTFEELGLTEGQVLEIGSGSGEHAVELLTRFPRLRWIASDLSEEARASCAAWAEFAKLEERLHVRKIDLLTSDSLSEYEGLDIVYSANVIHISPIGVLQNLIPGAAKILGPEGRLVLYGPFKRNGAHTSESNAQFDASLKSRNPAWGIRDLDLDVSPLAHANGLEVRTICEMPANNFLVVIGRI
jgi:precorrin-6B methylase 2